MWTLFSIPIFLFLYTGKVFHLRAFIGLWATGGLNETLKAQVFGKEYPRPKGACDCNIWADDGDQTGKPGMPSGHSAVTTYFSAFYYQYTTNPWIKAALVLYACLVMLSRYVKNCHSLPQIIAGSSLGLIMNALTIYAWPK
jgi:membrane-associated phospholipid phosphatase